MFLTLSQIISILIHYKYFLLFPIAVFEGPIIMVVAGSLAAAGFMNFWIAYLILAFGDLVGDAVYYAFGYYAKSSLLKRFGRVLGFDYEQVKKLESHFENHGGKTLLTGKFFHGVGGVFLVAAGAAKMKFWRYIGFNAIGTTPKTLLLVTIGYYFGRAITQIKSALDYFAVFAGVALVAALIYYLYRSKKT